MTPPPAGPRCDDTDLVLAARRRDPRAYGELFERWYDRCFDVAWNIVHDRETAADIAQDVFLVAWEHLSDLRDPAAFGGWILRTARNRALNRLERERTRAHEPIEDPDTERTVPPDPDADPAAISEVVDRRRLVWTAAGALGERDTSLLDLHLRHGLEPSEIAEELQITTNNAHQLLFRLRGKLKGTIGAALLWREGRPTCEQLAASVPAQRRFNADVAAVIQRHQRNCRVCAGEVSRATHPERLFSALPIAVAPALLRERALEALASAGVPIEPVTAAAGASAAGASAAAADPTVIGSVAGALRPAHVAPLRAQARAVRLAAGGMLAALVVVPVVGGLPEAPDGTRERSASPAGTAVVATIPDTSAPVIPSPTPSLTYPADGPSALPDPSGSVPQADLEGSAPDSSSAGQRNEKPADDRSGADSAREPSRSTPSRNTAGSSGSTPARKTSGANRTSAPAAPSRSDRRRTQEPDQRTAPSRGGTSPSTRPGWGWGDSRCVESRHGWLFLPCLLPPRVEIACGWVRSRRHPERSYRHCWLVFADPPCRGRLVPGPGARRCEISEQGVGGYRSSHR